LRQVITNLVGNAVKFTAEGEVVVELAPVTIERNLCRLAFQVVDTGIGISKEDQTRIFAPFTQVDAATTRRYSGTGLGLTIAQHLIRCFGSQLRLKSSPGSGSCFSFELALPIDVGSTDENEELAAKIKGLSVLVIDDNEASRQALVEQFDAWGMRAQAVANGEKAYDQIKATSKSGKPYDIAVVDALMPGIDGFSVASRIEADDSIPTKPIIMASATDRLEFSRRCAEAGAAAFVQKPISQSQLLNAVGLATGAAPINTPVRRGLFEQPSVQPVNVLLVEDTPANRKVVQKVLSKRGHNVAVAVNGREAIDAHRKQRFDLILMDVQMPIMDGFQATEAIRESEATNDLAPTPIVAMTAHSMRGDRERCLRAGMSSYLSKPLDLAKLISVVESVATAGQVDVAMASPAAAPGVAATGDKADGLSDKREVSSQTALIDLDAALARLRGDRNLLRDMIGFYREDAPTLLTAIRENLTSEDYPALERAAHSLKGLAATFDAEVVVTAARKLEVAASKAEVAEMPAKIDSLEKESAKLLQFFDDYLGRN
ncbi:MAG: response regulator, partial [Planctomycetota bacterium]